MDFNNDIESQPVRWWAADLGLVEAITHLHPIGAPPTFQRGSHPIDGIFAALQLLDQAAGGYLSFGDGIPSDHHAIWLDLHLPEIRPATLTEHIKPQAQWLQCQDPQVVNRYNMALLDILQKQSIPNRIKQLNDTLQGPSDLRQWYQRELNTIDHAKTETKKGTENQCHKLKCGRVQWCLSITQAINKILFWKSILKCELGGKVGITILTI